jgi:hypothetical protein
VEEKKENDDESYEPPESSSPAADKYSQNFSESSDFSSLDSSEIANEEEILTTAEKILAQVASKLIESGWTVSDAFGNPVEILETVNHFGVD